MGLVPPSGWMKAKMGSQVASETPQPSQMLRNLQPCVYLWLAKLPHRSIQRLPSLQQSSPPVCQPLEVKQRSAGLFL